MVSAARAWKLAIDDLLAAHDLTGAGLLQRVGLSAGAGQRTGVGVPVRTYLGLDPLGRLLERDVIKELRARGTMVF